MATGFSTADYAYDLPKDLIAQDPLPDRASSRLLVLDRETGHVSHHVFSEIASFLKRGDLLVLNDTKVIPARLYGMKPDTGAAVEILLLKRIAEKGEETRKLNAGRNICVWECLVKPGKKLKNGASIVFGKADAQGVFPLEAAVEEITPEGNRIIRFSFDGVFEEILDALGEMPLPPYITHKLTERDRYNTVYAKHDGSAAAPTAGLHFTKELLRELREKGVHIAYVTLHVGLGTFRPVKVKDIRDHHMHSEWYNVPEETARLINETKQNGGRVICVGTTSCRTLESAARAGSAEEPSPLFHCNGDLSGETDIFICPGCEFRVMDGLITNFHLPESTLLMLVSAFAGREHVLVAYREAVEKRYRFFSFGDAMLVI